MLYYGDRQREIAPQQLLGSLALELQAAHDALSCEAANGLVKWHPALVDAAISLGELHQAVADHLHPEEDGVSPLTDRLAEAGVSIGRCVYRSWRVLSGDGTAGEGRLTLAELLDDARRSVIATRDWDLPQRLTARAPEGFAFYCLYPEMYFANVDKLVREVPSPGGYLVIGIRSIGTALAALVAGALAEKGLNVDTETVRPRGHPFDRYLRLSPELTRRLKAAGQESIFVVVDEGPGLTCSSFVSVCRQLEQLGVPESGTVVVSAWRGAPSIYASEDLRARWARQRVFHTSAEETFDGWKKLFPFFLQHIGKTSQREARVTGEEASNQNCGERVSTRWNVADLSYGRWREMLYTSESAWPAIHRPTERTKLLLTPVPPTLESRVESRESETAPFTLHPSPFSPTPPLPHSPSPPLRILAKFAGLGEYGREKRERARTLAEAGFGPPVLGLSHGFLLQEFVEGRPLKREDLKASLIRRMAAYYGFIHRRFGKSPGKHFAHLAEMLIYNSRQVLGAGAEDLAQSFVDRWRPRADHIDRLLPVALDGHPFPHEWIETSEGAGQQYLKTDGADHFADHTMVGEQSILWDLAGTCEEWEMTPAQVAGLMSAWETETSDHASGEYLTFYRAAYLAFRTGALHYAIHSTDEAEIRELLLGSQAKVICRLEAILTEKA